jgi:hypothetical protein
MLNPFEFFFGSNFIVSEDKISKDDVLEIVDEIKNVGEFVLESFDNEELTLEDKLKISEKMCEEIIQVLNELTDEK